MRCHLLPLACGFWFVMTASATCAGRDTPSRAAATAPDGQIRVELSLAERDQAGVFPAYAIFFNGPAKG
jgi:hypothetical protein